MFFVFLHISKHFMPITILVVILCVFFAFDFDEVIVTIVKTLMYSYFGLLVFLRKLDH